MMEIIPMVASLLGLATATVNLIIAAINQARARKGQSRKERRE